MSLSHPVSTPIQLRSVLRALRQSRHLSQEQLGRRLALSQKRIARIESLPGRTSFDQISRMVAALGGRLVIEVAPQSESDSSVEQDTKPNQIGW
jgi:HTH-type transcriptional regulator/antitoxin HipB